MVVARSSFSPPTSGSTNSIVNRWLGSGAAGVLYSARIAIGTTINNNKISSRTRYSPIQTIQ